jgi:PAS domain S-box-containing protein
MFGCRAGEIIGQPITRIIPPSRLDEESLILDRLRQGERLVHFQTERQCKDGRIIPVTLTISPIRDDEGKIIGVSKVMAGPLRRFESFAKRSTAQGCRPAPTAHHPSRCR